MKKIFIFLLAIAPNFLIGMERKDSQVSITSDKSSARSSRASSREPSPELKRKSVSGATIHQEKDWFDAIRKEDKTIYAEYTEKNFSQRPYQKETQLPVINKANWHLVSKETYKSIFGNNKKGTPNESENVCFKTIALSDEERDSAFAAHQFLNIKNKTKKTLEFRLKSDIKPEQKYGIFTGVKKTFFKSTKNSEEERSQGTFLIENNPLMWLVSRDDKDKELLAKAVLRFLRENEDQTNSNREFFTQFVNADLEAIKEFMLLSEAMENGKTPFYMNQRALTSLLGLTSIIQNGEKLDETLQIFIKEQQELREDNGRLQIKNEGLQKQQQELKEGFDHLTKTINEMLELNTINATKNEEIKKNYLETKKQNEGLNKAIDEKEKQRKEQIDKLDNINKNHSEEKTKWLEASEQLNKKVSTLEITGEALNEKNETLNTELANVKKQNIELDSTIGTNKKLLEELTTINKAQLEANAKVVQEKKELDGVNEGLKTKLAGVEEQNRTLNETVKKKELENQAANEKLSEVSETIKKFEAAEKKMQEEKTKLDGEHEALKKTRTSEKEALDKVNKELETKLTRIFGYFNKADQEAINKNLQTTEQKNTFKAVMLENKNEASYAALMEALKEKKKPVYMDKTQKIAYGKYEKSIETRKTESSSINFLKKLASTQTAIGSMLGAGLTMLIIKIWPEK